MSASEPPMTYRNGFKMLSRRAWGSSARRSVGGACLRPTRQPVHRRHDLVTGFNTERRNLTQCYGATRNSEEAAVMAVEQRGCVICRRHCANREDREEHGEVRQTVAHHQADGVGSL
uniref:OrfB n=1 Tax=Bradyrhizobium japonicum TaxID=375 RepID=Q45276_BRAJP|nr:putative [Bradyrhizobium japonicum]